jgi:hypothetical protein|tara:strand:+ start:70 stop:642 length:573 start_codon:yes stop_codon:yes gene_type:complete
MANKTRTFLKNQNRDFNNILDSVATLSDAQTLSGANTFSGVNTVTGGMNVAPVTLTPAASVTLTKAANSGRLNLIPSVATSNDEYVIPVAAAAGETYEIAWSGVAADADDILFVAPSANGLTFSGGVLQFDTDATDASGYTIAFPGGDDDKLTIVNPESFCIKFVATSTTNYHVSGYAMSTDTAVAFGDI